MTFKNQIFNDKGCQVCGTLFTPKSSNNKLCSDECKLVVRRASNRKRWLNTKYRKEQRERKLKIAYGIDQNEYDKILLDQGGVCKICSKTEEDNGRKLPVDHCHDTGKVRGILCDICNRSLGFLNDDVDRILSAAFYLMESKDD